MTLCVRTTKKQHLLCVAGNRYASYAAGAEDQFTEGPMQPAHRSGL